MECSVEDFVAFLVLHTAQPMTVYVKYIQANIPTQIIQRVRSSVRSIIDLDYQHQNQGMCTHDLPLF